jgi:hypothetical protein
MTIFYKIFLSCYFKIILLTSADKLGMVVAVAVVIIFVGIGVGMSNVEPEKIVQTISDRPTAQQQIAIISDIKPITPSISSDFSDKNQIKKYSNEFGNIKKIAKNLPDILSSDAPIINQGHLSKLPQISLNNLPIVLSFNDNIDGSFEYTQQLRDRISNLRNNGDFDNQISNQDKFVEYEDKIILYKRTIIQITSVDQYNYIFKPTPTEDSRYSNDLDSNQFGNIVNAVFENIKDKKELISTIKNKIGFHSQTEYVTIPKSGIVSCYDISSEDKSCVDLDNGQILDIPQSEKFNPPRTHPNNSPFLADVENCTIEDGTYTCNADFLNGFTYGISWHKGLESQYTLPEYVSWAIWAASLGAFDISQIWDIHTYVDIQNGFGLRLPIMAEVVVTNFESEDSQITGFNSEYTLSGMNFTANEFQEIGVRETQLFNGNEFVLVASNSAFLDVRLFDGIISIGPEELQLGAFDQSRDFTTPMGNDRVRIISIEVPGSDLGLVYSILFLTGQVDLRVDVDGGSEHVEAQIRGANLDQNARDENTRFETVRDSLFASDTFSVNVPGDDFGFELSELEYYPLFEVTPNARLAITLGLPGALATIGLDGGQAQEAAVALFGDSYTYHTDYYPLFTLSIEPGFSFDSHDGTSGKFVFSYEGFGLNDEMFDVEEHPGLNP